MTRGKIALALTCSLSAGFGAFADPPAVKPGIDVLIADGFKPLAGKRVGLITNPTGITSDLRSTIDVLHGAKDVKLVALFGPEHGVRGDTPAGDTVADAKDGKTGLPSYSLYGKNRQPTDEMLAGIDVLVFDIQDVGARSYTYISTMATVMEAAADHHLGFVVLDRPNPLGGERIEGRILDPKFKSFVSYLPVPYLYGLTPGELARMIAGEKWLPDGKQCDLTVVPMQGWKRSMSFAQTGLSWVPASPHVPRADSAYFYAATGIIGELHILSEGVGYPLPFEMFGAPDIDAEKFAGFLNARKIPGVYFRPAYYQPFYGRFKEKTCGGVQIHLLNPAEAPLTEIGFTALDIAKRELGIKLPDNKRVDMFDKVCGTDEVRKMFERGAPIDEILAYWKQGVEEFRAQRAKYLLYE